jgi:hypothetical protein
MKSGLPTPAINYLPRNFQDDPWMIVLAAALDRASSQVQADIVGMKDWRIPESCPSQLLVELGAMLGVTILSSDSDAQKRKKIATAVHSQKYNGTWVYSAKPVIDAITGYSAVIWTSSYSDWPIRIGDGSYYALGYAWMLRGGTSPTDGYTIIRTGSGWESIIPGTVYIDVGTSGLTPDQVNQIVASLLDVVPAYIRVLIGYTTAGVFTTYVQIG